MKKNLIKIMSFILIAVVLQVSLLSVAFADTSPAISMSSDKKDNKLILSLYYKNVPGLIGTRFEVLFDKDIIKPVEITHNGTDAEIVWNSVLRNEEYIEAYNFREGKVLYAGAFLNDISDIGENTSDIHYLDIIFEIADGRSADVNGSAVEIKSVINFPGKKLPVEFTYIVDPDSDPDLPSKRFAGDVNNDGKVTAADARRILRYSVSLEDISKEDIAYANMDFNDSISASDARFALRASVGLEKLHGHFYESDNGKYICSYCKKGFALKSVHIHSYVYPDCYGIGVCGCGKKSTEIRGHIYTSSSPECSECGLDVVSMIGKTKTVLGYIDAIRKYDKNGSDAYSKGDMYTFLEATLYITVYYEDIINVLSGCDDLAKSREEFIKAHKIMDEAINGILTPSKDIYVTSANAAKMLYARNEAVKYEKQAIVYLAEATDLYVK